MGVVAAQPLEAEAVHGASTSNAIVERETTWRGRGQRTRWASPHHQDGSDNDLTVADALEGGFQVALAVGANSVKIAVTAVDETERTITATVRSPRHPRASAARDRSSPLSSTSAPHLSYRGEESSVTTTGDYWGGLLGDRRQPGGVRVVAGGNVARRPLTRLMSRGAVRRAPRAKWDPGRRRSAASGIHRIGWLGPCGAARTGC